MHRLRIADVRVALLADRLVQVKPTIDRKVTCAPSSSSPSPSSARTRSAATPSAAVAATTSSRPAATMVASARYGDTSAMHGRLTSTHLVGRVAELAELELAQAQAAARRPALVLLAGESGVGKTRLLSEFEHT